MDKVRIRPDELQHNADWTKNTWDLPRSLHGFLDLLGVGSEDSERSANEAVAYFMEVKPAAKYMPNQLRQELAARKLLFGHRAEPHYRATVDKVDDRTVIGALRIRKNDAGKTRYFIVNKSTGPNGIRIDPETLDPMD